MRIICILPDWKPTYSNKNVGKLFLNYEKKKLNFALYCSKNSDITDFNNRFKFGTIYTNRPELNKKSFSTWIISFISFIKVLFVFRPNYVLWTYVGYKETFFLSILRLFNGPKYVIKMDSMKIHNKNFYQKLRNLILINFPFYFSSKILCETEEIYKLLYSYGSKRMLFPNGVPKSLLDLYNSKYNQIKSSISSPYFLYTGRIMHLKGLHLLVEAFEKIHKKIPEWKVVIVGEVIEPTYWKKIQKRLNTKKIKDKFVFIDFSEGFEYYKWHYFAKIFVMPSLDEGLPNRMVESMFFKLPIISYDVGQVHEYVDNETGFLISEVGNSDILSKSMLDLAENPNLLDTFSLNAYDIAKKLDDEVLFDKLFKSTLLRF